jgi:hypothetical protein
VFEAEGDVYQLQPVSDGLKEVKGTMTALEPSLTMVARGGILSLEEKFQGGAGVNITPLPPSIIALNPKP